MPPCIEPRLVRLGAAAIFSAALAFAPLPGFALDLGSLMNAASAVQGALKDAKPILPGKKQTFQGRQAEAQAKEKEAANARPPDAPASSAAQAPGSVLPPPPPAGTYALGTVDLNSTALITRQIDKSHGFSYNDDVFSYLKPKFANDTARSLYERSIDQPMDPAYYASKRWAMDPKKNVMYKSEIEALPAADQAQVLANLLLAVRSTESHAFNLFRAFPQLQDIEYVWTRPKLDGNGQTVTVGGGDLRRGNAWDFLSSDVLAGVPDVTFHDRSQNYPQIATAILKPNLDNWKRQLAKEQGLPPAAAVPTSVATGANVLVHYQGVAMDEPYSGPRMPASTIAPQAPRVAGLSIKLELDMPSIPANTKFSIDSYFGPSVDWTPVDEPNGWKHARLLSFEVSDGVRTMRFIDHIGTMRLGFTTDAAGKILGWAMIADAPFARVPMKFESSNRNENSLCPSKFMDMTWFKDEHYKQFASMGCSQGLWSIAVNR